MARNEQKIADKNILKSLLRTAATFTGIYLLSNLAIFVSKDFLTPGLTREQLEMMDKHNFNHHQEDLIDYLGRGVGAGLNIVKPTASKEIQAVKIANSKEANAYLDSDVIDLPPPLNHRHTE